MHRIPRGGRGGVQTELKFLFVHKEEEEGSEGEGAMMEDVVVIVGLIFLQFAYSGNSIMLSYLMSLGLNSLSFSITASVATCFMLAPFAAFFERKLWPSNFSLKLIAMLVALGIGGVTLFQTFFMRGVKSTSAAMGTAMPNLGPGIIFVLAWIMRMEQVDLRCIYSKVKILGTVLCVSGALLLSLMHSKSTNEPLSPTQSENNTFFDKERVAGCLYLLAAVFMQSAVNIMQAIALIEFPAPMSMCAITSLIGAFTTLFPLLLEGHGFDMGSTDLSLGKLGFFSLLAGGIGSCCLSFNGWAIKKRGAVMASIFSPISTVCSVLFSVMTSQETISLYSLCGVVLMFAGLYLFLWSKGKERHSNEVDEEKPLLNSCPL